MTLIIVILLLLGYVVIATGHTTGVNKSAIAIFIGAGDNNSTIDFVKKAQITTIDGIQKKYNEMAAGAQLSSDPILIGNYEVTGKASSSLTTPHSQIPCLYYSYSALHNYEELVEVEVEDKRASTEKRKKYKYEMNI